jgi:hypothetical protein
LCACIRSGCAAFRGRGRWGAQARCYGGLRRAAPAGRVDGGARGETDGGVTGRLDARAQKSFPRCACGVSCRGASRVVWSGWALTYCAPPMVHSPRPPRRALGGLGNDDDADGAAAAAALRRLHRAGCPAAKRQTYRVMVGSPCRARSGVWILPQRRAVSHRVLCSPWRSPGGRLVLRVCSRRQARPLAVAALGRAVVASLALPSASVSPPTVTPAPAAYTALPSPRCPSASPAPSPAPPPANIAALLLPAGHTQPHAGRIGRALSPSSLQGSASVRHCGL